AATDGQKLFIWAAANQGVVQEFDLAGIKTLVAGNKHVAALTEDGKAWVWSEDGSGAPEGVEMNVITELESGTTFTTIAAGGNATLAVTETGSITGWGSNADSLSQSSEDGDSSLTLDVQHLDTNGEFVI